MFAYMVVMIRRFGAPADSYTAWAFMGKSMPFEIRFSESDFMAVCLFFLLLAGGLAVAFSHNGVLFIDSFFCAPATRNGLETPHHGVIPSFLEWTSSDGPRFHDAIFQDGW